MNLNYLTTKHTRTGLDLTKGNLFWKTPRFVLPLMFTMIFQLLYTTVDLWTVSAFGGGSMSMSAIGSNTPLINLITTVLVSIATGANVTISIAKGKNDQEKANKLLHTSFYIALFGGILFALIGIIFAKDLLRLMGTPDSILDNATIYVQIYCLGLPMLMIYNFGSQMLRALGDSKRPLYILLIAGILNVLFDLLFVIVLKLDVKGVAYATIISETISALLVLIWFTINKYGFARISWKHFKFYKEEFFDILKIGIPAGIQGLAFCIPNVMIQSSLYTIKDYYINGILISQEEIVIGAAASAQIEGYVFVILDSFAIGVVSFAGQNYGAKNELNIKKVFYYAQIWMMIFWSISAILCGLIPQYLLSIFVKSSEGINIVNAISAGQQRLFIMVFTYFLDGMMDINGNYLRGIKNPTTPAILTIIGCAGSRILFLTTLFNLPFFHTIFWLYAAFPISWILVNIVYIPILIKNIKKVTYNFKIDKQLEIINNSLVTK